ncbi:hypothetical protein ACFL4K_03320 [Candidatus Neomarinimicrobiota bacterium]
MRHLFSSPVTGLTWVSLIPTSKLRTSKKILPGVFQLPAAGCTVEGKRRVARAAGIGIAVITLVYILLQFPEPVGLFQGHQVMPITSITTVPRLSLSVVTAISTW